MTNPRYPKNSTTSRALGLFHISDRRVPAPLIRAYLHVKSACARANWDCGTLSTGHRNHLVRSVRYLLEHEDHWAGYFPIDRFMAGAGTTLNMNVNEAIAAVARRQFRALGIHANDIVNRSQSTNDTYPTALRVALLCVQSTLTTSLQSLCDALQSKCEEFSAIPKAGRTHLQDAVPMLLGDQFGSYARTFQKLAVRWQEAHRALTEIPLGGTAVGNGINTPHGFRKAALRHLRKETRIDDLQAPQNPFEVQASALDFLTYAQALAATCIELQRISTDLRIQASGPSTGLHELEFPRLLAGSSIMPGKTNPTGLEMAHQVAIEGLGVHEMVAWAALQGNFELNVMLPAIAPALVESSEHLALTLDFLVEHVILPATPCEEHLRRHWKSTEQWATLLAPEWGYDRVSHWVLESKSSGLPFLDWVEQTQGIQITPQSLKSTAPARVPKKKR